MAVEIAIALIVSFLHHSASEIEIIGNLISKVLLVTLVHLLSLLKSNTSHYANISKHCFLLLLGASFSCIFISYSIYIFYHINSSMLVRTFSVIMIIFLILLNMSYYVIEDRLSHAALLMTQNLLLSRELKYYGNLLDTRKFMEHSFSKERHNLKNQLLAIRSYAIQNDNAQIIEFINSLISEPVHGIVTTTTTFCDNLLLNTLFNAKINLARQYNIKYLLDIDVPSELPFDNVNLCNFIGNALDNCFDTCLQDKDFASKYIHVTIKFNANCLFCQFINSCYHDLKITKKSHFLSTKQAAFRHGYGMTTIKQVISLYNGILDIKTLEHKFILKAILYPHS